MLNFRPMEPSIKGSLNQKFKVNEPGIVAESIDGEVIIINLNSGAYYSSTSTGERIWQSLTHGLSLREAIDLICTEYEGDPGYIQQQVIDFAMELRDEGLIGEDAGAATEPSTPEARTSAGQAFEKPVLSKYTDMQELLLLDPIHDIDPAVGWPFAKAAD